MIGEVHELSPVERFNRVASVADVVTDVRLNDGFTDWRGFFGFKALFSEEFVDWAGVVGGKVFSSAVCPGVPDSAVNVDGAWSDACEEHVLIDWKVVFVVDEFPGIATKPVGESGDHFFEGFA